MKKKYLNACVEIVSVNTATLMIPNPESCPDPGSAPKRHWVPGPGASYDPQGSVV